MSHQPKQRSIRDEIAAFRPTLRTMLRDAGLRPTMQRMAIGSLLFANGDRHVTAEMIYMETGLCDMSFSLATVYNTLHKFAQAGLLRQVTIDSAKIYFDTNSGNHHHFFVEETSLLFDIPDGELPLAQVPPAPDGFEVAQVDVVVRLKRKPDSALNTVAGGTHEKVTQV